jgi:hypothetical protein
MLQKSDSVTKIAKAVLGVQKDLKPAFKGSNNPYFKSKYADLNACWDAVRDLLQKNDLVLIQMPGTSVDMRPTLTTLLLHTSGEYLMDEAILLIDKQNAQGYGSAVTYYRRYGLSAVLGLISDEDDDGNAASTTNSPQAEKTVAQTETTQPAAKRGRPPKETPIESSRLHGVPKLEEAQTAATERAKAEVDKQAEVMTEQAWNAIRKELEQFNLDEQGFHHWLIKTLRANNLVVPENMATLTKTSGGTIWLIANASNKAGTLLDKLA